MDKAKGDDQRQAGNASSTTLRCVRRSAASSEKLFMTCSPRDVPVISRSEAPEGSWWWRPWATGAARPTSRSPAPRIRYWEDRPKLLGDAVGGDLVCVRHDGQLYTLEHRAVEVEMQAEAYRRDPSRPVRVSTCANAQVDGRLCLTGTRSSRENGLRYSARGHRYAYAQCVAALVATLVRRG